MSQRINYQRDHKKLLKGMLVIEKQVHETGLDKTIYELIKLRASQINGCAYCIDMHSKDARARGETEQRLFGLTAWRESPYYSKKERAALDWTESLTLISENNVSDELYKKLRDHFEEGEIMALTMAIVAINGWNRLAISMRTPPGSYNPNT